MTSAKRRKTVSLVLAALLLSFPCAAEDAPVRRTDNPWVVLRAFLVSYPDHIQGVDFDASMKEWFMVIDDRRLYWAGGRLLPKEDLAKADAFRPYVDYLYPRAIPDPAHFTEEIIASLKNDVLTEQRKNAPVYDMAFYDALYDGATRIKIESHIVRFDYLGKRVSVHENIVEPLKRVETKIMKLAEGSPEVADFVNTITSIEGYNWREIADSPSRSNHSWGIAVDILPKNWGKKNLYWNWISYWNDEWMLIPLDRRWMPPLAVIEAFESEGFIWGGKWLLWDNMHFEYRPELLALQAWGYTGKNTDEP